MARGAGGVRGGRIRGRGAMLEAICTEREKLGMAVTMYTGT